MKLPCPNRRHGWFPYSVASLAPFMSSMREPGNAGRILLRRSPIPMPPQARRDAWPPRAAPPCHDPPASISPHPKRCRRSKPDRSTPSPTRRRNRRHALPRRFSRRSQPRTMPSSWRVLAIRRLLCARCRAAASRPERPSPGLTPYEAASQRSRSTSAKDCAGLASSCCRWPGSSARRIATPAPMA